jgi:glycosyltransferase involved in cell wall biosynthesis
LDLDEKLVVSYGFAGWSKAIPVALAGFALLRQRVKARLVFAGECVSDFGRAPDGVVLGTGFLPEAQYRLWLSAADVALQLREGPGGAISGALQDAIVAGRPGVATADLADNIEAPDYVRRVENTPEEIAAALEAVLAEPGATEEARQAFIASYSMAEYAQNLLNLLEL